MLEATFVHLDANDNRHEEEEEDLEGADPGNGGMGLLREEDGLIVRLKYTIGLVEASSKRISSVLHS